MNTPPKSVLVAGLLFLASAVYGLITGTLGLELFPFHVAAWLAITMAIVHVYAGLGLWSGDAYARSLALWLLGAGLLGSFYAMFGVVNSGEASVAAIAPNVVNVLVVSFFLWHLSGPEAVAYTGDGHAHDAHAH